ncbi:unnamed protein product [Mesocestoides corti]|nr:unnamed protein product [Mesocestoides corti]
MPADISRDSDANMAEPPKKKFLYDSSPLETTSVLDTVNTECFAPKVSTETCAVNAYLPIAGVEFQDPVVFERLKGTIKLQLQGSVTQAVNNLLNKMSSAIEEVNNLKKCTNDMQMRLHRLETISRKVETIIVESMPPTHKTTASTASQSSSQTTVVVPARPNQVKEYYQPTSQSAHSTSIASNTVSQNAFNHGNPRQSTSSTITPHPLSQISRPAAPLPVTETPVAMAMAYVNHLANQPLLPNRIAPLPPRERGLLPANPYGQLAYPDVQPPLRLSISTSSEGLCLQWELAQEACSFEPASVYQLFSYASSDIDPRLPFTSKLWQKVGDIEALALPMVCTLTSVLPNNIYYFVVRSIDRFQRSSDWSNVVNAHIS